MSFLEIPEDVVALILLDYSGPIIATCLKRTCAYFRRVLDTILGHRVARRFPKIGLPFSNCKVRSLMCRAYIPTRGCYMEEYTMVGHRFICPSLPLTILFLPMIAMWFGQKDYNIVIYLEKEASRTSAQSGDGMLVFVHTHKNPTACFVVFNSSINSRLRGSVTTDGDIDLDNADDFFFHRPVAGVIDVEGIKILIDGISYSRLTHNIYLALETVVTNAASKWRRTVLQRKCSVWACTDQIRFIDSVIERAPPGKRYVGLYSSD